MTAEQKGEHRECTHAEPSKVSERRPGGVLALFILISVLLPSCTWYKPEIQSNKCAVNEECGQGFACRAGRCEDIYHPRRKIRQY